MLVHHRRSAVRLAQQQWTRCMANPQFASQRTLCTSTAVGLRMRRGVELQSTTDYRSLSFFQGFKKEEVLPDETAAVPTPPAKSANVAAPTPIKKKRAVAVTPSPEANTGSEEEDAAIAHAAKEIEDIVSNLKDAYLRPYDVLHFCRSSSDAMPMVMLLGNHSSGKSTFINYLAGRDIQQTGVAPTDDGFTIIRRDRFDMNDDGPTAVSNPTYRFEELQSFGSYFTKRLRVKTRVMPATSTVPMNVAIVDTPGMIDTPVNVADRTSFDGQRRGYDFLAATRWFAERSDVIVLMFDPANPGTTGETLDVLTKSLSGCEHKFLLVLNKVDVFDNVTDFARAYGALCWNLSKVLAMKDIPRIFTTCTPIRSHQDAEDGTTPAEGEEEDTELNSLIPSIEIERQRGEILEEIRSAPLRRLDNILTATEESAQEALMAARVFQVLRSDYLKREISLIALVSVGCCGLPPLFFTVSGSILGTLALTVCGVASGVLARMHLPEYRTMMLTNCDSVFQRLYPSEDLNSPLTTRWRQRVKPELLRHLNAKGGNGSSSSFPSIPNRACKQMEGVIAQELPTLRMKVAKMKADICRQRGVRLEG